MFGPREPECRQLREHAPLVRDAGRSRSGRADDIVPHGLPGVEVGTVRGPPLAQGDDVPERIADRGLAAPEAARLERFGGDLDTLGLQSGEDRVEVINDQAEAPFVPRARGRLGGRRRVGDLQQDAAQLRVGGFGTAANDCNGDAINDCFGDKTFNTPPLIEAADIPRHDAKRSGKNRIARMVDSPYHAEREILFTLADRGIVDPA